MRSALLTGARTFAIAAVGAATTWAALTSWRGLVTYPSAYLTIAGALAVVLAVLAAVTAGLPARVSITLETLACIEVVSWTATSDARPVHIQAVLDAIDTAARTVDLYRVPLDRSIPTVTPMLVLGAAGFLLLVQLLVVHLRRPSLAGLALLAIFALHAGFTGVGSSARSFVGTAAGFLVLVLLDARQGHQRWGRPEAAADAPPERRLRRVLGSATPVGAIAIALAVLVGATLPLPDGGLIDLAGADRAKVTIHKPVVDMRAQLDQQPDIPLIDIATDEPHPGYLRIGVLNRFTGTEWSSGDRNVSPERIADGPVPLSPGISPELTGTEYSVLAHALPAFDSTWLPTAYPANRVVAVGDWRWDPATMDFAGAGDTNTADESYSMATVDLDYGTNGHFFRDPPAGSYPDEDIYVPATVSDFVRRLAERVTAGTTTNYERARLLQAFFRSTGHFTYSIHNAPVGTDGQVLDTFLRNGPGGRVGFCQQFASAMAIMARIVGIPARVAVGFLTPAKIGPREYEYSSHDLHAWTELYFAGAGWVRFDPTPAERVPLEPAYSTVPVEVPDGGGQHTGHSHVHSGGGPSQQPTKSPGSSVPSYETPANHQGGPAVASTHPAEWVLGGVLVLLVFALALLATAGGVRRRRRALRLAGDPEAVWSEVRATARDLAIGWPAGRSPRETGRHLVAHLTQDGRHVDPAVLDAVEDLVSSLEEFRYGSRAVAVATRTDTGVQGATIVAALEETASRSRRRRARWVPLSLGR